MVDRCIYCQKEIPEGKQFCTKCESEQNERIKAMITHYGKDKFKAGLDKLAKAVRNAKD